MIPNSRYRIFPREVCQRCLPPPLKPPQLWLLGPMTASYIENLLVRDRRLQEQQALELAISSFIGSRRHEYIHFFLLKGTASLHY